MEEKAQWHIGKYTYEIAFLLVMFLLTIVNKWIVLNSFNYFFNSPIFFLIIYLQAQLYRFIVMPLLASKKYLQFLIISILYLAVLTFIFCIANYYWPNQDFHHGQRKSGKFIIYHIAICIISTIILMSLSLTRQYYRELEKRTKDQLLLSEMNIRLLHAQLNPHFFFNMFNNLYGVSLTDPDRVPDLILQLSHLMRYPLEKGSKPLVSIQEELDFIETYINMEKERSGKRCTVTLVLPGDKESLARYQIASLILITLVENAFKHSAGSLENWFVKLHFEFSNEEFRLCVWNSIPLIPVKKESTGIGLSNISKRLELLYPQKYTFETSQSGEEYKTMLNIQLSALCP